MTTLRYQRVVLAPVKTVYDLAIMAVGILVAIWPLVLLYFVVRAVL